MAEKMAKESSKQKIEYFMLRNLLDKLIVIVSLHPFSEFPRLLPPTLPPPSNYPNYYF